MTSWSETFEQIPITVSQRIHDKWTTYGIDTEYDSSQSQVFFGGSIARSGVRTPNYRALKKAGRLPAQPGSRHDTSTRNLSAASYTLRLRHRTQEITYVGDFSEVVPFGFPTNLSLLSNEDYFTLVYSEALRNFASDYSAQCAHLMSTLAEFDETRRALRDAVDSMSGNYVREWGKAPKRIRRLKKATDVMKALADIHLGVVFGINPILQDAKSIAEALAEIQNRFDSDRYKAYGSATETRSSESPGPSGGFQGITTALIFESTDTFTRRYKVKLGGRVTVPYANVDPLAIAGITPWDIVPGAWEGVPFSWLVDSFSNIGDVLNAMYHPQWYLDKTWIVIVRESSAVRKCTATGSNYDQLPDYVVSIAGTPARLEEKSFAWNRSGWVPTMLPEITWKQPSFRQVTNAASAAVQSIAGAVNRSVRSKLGPMNRRSYTGPWDLEPRG
jgi:hypothetical protein